MSKLRAKQCNHPPTIDSSPNTSQTLTMAGRPLGSCTLSRSKLIQPKLKKPSRPRSSTKLGGLHLKNSEHFEKLAVTRQHSRILHRSSKSHFDGTTNPVFAHRKTNSMSLGKGLDHSSSSAQIEERFQTCQQSFAQYISQHPKHGPFLANIKAAYEQHIEHLSKALTQQNEAMRQLKAAKAQIQTLASKEQQYLDTLKRLEDDGVPVNEYLDTAKAEPKYALKSDRGPLGLKLVLPVQTPGIGFHQEFMTHFDEFSESWRKQITTQKSDALFTRKH